MSDLKFFCGFLALAMAASFAACDDDDSDASLDGGHLVTDATADADAGDGSTADGSTSDGSTADGSTSDGSTTDTDGSTTDTDGSTTDTDGSTTDTDGSTTDAGPVEPVCGDGVVNGEDECDDGNNRDSDGCSSDCKFEDDFVCENIAGRTPAESVCHAGTDMNNDTCDKAIALADKAIFNGNSCRANADYNVGPSCTGEATVGKDVFYKITIPAKKMAHIEFYDTDGANLTFYVIDQCGASGCLKPKANNGRDVHAGDDSLFADKYVYETKYVNRSDAEQTVYVVVDSQNDEACGKFAIGARILDPMELKGDVCSDAIPMQFPAAMTVDLGDTTNQLAFAEGVCTSHDYSEASASFMGGDRFYSVTIPKQTQLHVAALEQTSDVGLFLLDECGAATCAKGENDYIMHYENTTDAEVQKILAFDGRYHGDYGYFKLFAAQEAVGHKNGGQSCAEPQVLQDGQVLFGNSCNGQNVFTPGPILGLDDDWFDGPEHFYKISLEDGKTLALNIFEYGGDLGIYTLNTCDVATATHYQDLSGFSHWEYKNDTGNPVERIVVIDSWHEGECGEYILQVEVK